MAFSGRKVFSAGDVLTASDLNSIVDQTVMVFADSTARDTAIPSPVEGMVAYLSSNDSISKYIGSQWTNIQVALSFAADRAVITDSSGDIAVSAVTSIELGLLSGLTADSSELNILDGATLTTTELNYVDGVTSSIQTQLDTLQDNPTANLQTESGTTYTITSSDAGKTIIFDSGSDITITVNDSSGFNAGERVDIIQDGAGVITITASTATVAGNGVSTTSGSFTIGERYQAATLLCVGTNNYRLIGNIEEVA